MIQHVSEHGEQVNLFYWAFVNRAKHPALELMFAIPNGGHRHIAVARKLKAEGVKAGVPDIFLPFPSVGSQWPNPKGCHGFFIELKAIGGRVSPFQEQWHGLLRSAGYACEVCWGWESAAKMIVNYLGLDARRCGL